MELGMTQYASSVSVYQNLLKGRRLWNPKRAFTLNMNERKWQQPQFHLHLITKSHGRWELGLLISSAAIHLRKMMPRMMFRSIQTFFVVNGTFTERFHLCVCVCVCVCARIDFHFTIFVCSLYNYRSSATFKLLHHFGFVRSGLSVRTFRTTDAKYVIFRVGWCKSLKDSTTWY